MEWIFGLLALVAIAGFAAFALVVRTVWPLVDADLKQLDD